MIFYSSVCGNGIKYGLKNREKLVGPHVGGSPVRITAEMHTITKNKFDCDTCAQIIVKTLEILKISQNFRINTKTSYLLKQELSASHVCLSIVYNRLHLPISE